MRVRGERPKRGLVVALTTALLAAGAIFASPAAANPPDPTRPDIELSATASVDRPFTWTITKTADVDELTLQLGQSATVNYTITVATVEGPTGYSVNGEVFVYNKELEAVTVNDVTVDISGVGPANVRCIGAVLPRSLNSGAQMRCVYSLALPDNSNRTATATAFVGSSSFSAAAAIDFTNASVDNRIDHCVDVYDTNLEGFTDQICVNKVNKTVTYSKEIGPFETCGRQTVENTAWFVTNHTATEGEVTNVIDVNVPCPAPCEIGDYVWHDKNPNGIQDSALYGINGVRLDLLDSAGTIVDTTATANNPSNGKAGWYVFKVDCGAAYRVSVNAINFAPGGPLEDMSATLQNAGPDNLDSDGDPLTHTSHVVVVPSGSDLTVDFGYYEKKKDGCKKYDKYGKCDDDDDKCDKYGYDKYGKCDYDDKCNKYYKSDKCDKYDKYGYDRCGWGHDGRDRDGYDKKGYDRKGYDRKGYDKYGYDKYGKRRR